MEKKVLATTMAALMVTSLTACRGSAKETTVADIVAVAIAEERAEDTMAAESKDGINAEAAEIGAAKEAAGSGLIMAISTELPLYEYHDGDAVIGIGAEIAKVIADELGIGLEIEDIASDSIIPGIVSGKADMGLVGMTVTEDRMQFVDSPNIYARASQKIIVTEDSEIVSPGDSEGVIVGVQLGTTGDIYVSDLEADGTMVEHYNKGFEAVQASSRGKIDAVVIDGEPAKTFVAETQGLKALDESLVDEEYATAVGKGNAELLEKISGALKTLKDNGTLGEIATKYIKAE